MRKDSKELDEGARYIGYREAVAIVAANLRPLGEEALPLCQCVHRVVSADVAAAVSYPSIDVSLKDGFAVRSADVARADERHPVYLKVIGSAFAGSGYSGPVRQGNAVKLCSGSPIPDGADAVVSGEFCEEGPRGDVTVRADAGPGRNILKAGIEVSAGAVIAEKGERLLPGRLGLAAAAGVSAIRVYRRPCAAILSVGDEVVAPGGVLHAGQLYASNLVTLEAWLASFGISCVTSVVPDDERAIRRELEKRLPDADVILTSGGAWGSERDLVVGTMDRLGWQKRFHYVRMGPGKGIAFGSWKRDVPVFCLPGGPLSNEMAFLQLALPALLRMEGDSRAPLPIVHARLTEDVKGRHRAWTEFKDAILARDERGLYTVSLYKSGSRLQAIARAEGLIRIPEGVESLRCGETIPVQLLARRLDDL